MSAEAILNHMVEYPPTLDSTFKALGDPTRRRIVARLARGPQTVTELAEPLDMTLAGVSKHIRVLVDSGVVTQHKRGRRQICTLRPEALTNAERWLRTQHDFWSRSLDRLERLLEEDDA